MGKGATFTQLRHDVHNWSLDDLVSFKLALKKEVINRYTHHTRVYKAAPTGGAKF